MRYMHLIIISVFFCGTAFGGKKVPVHYCCHQELAPRPEPKSWTELLTEGGEPTTLLEAYVLGLKIGAVIVSPFAVPIAGCLTRSSTKTLKTAALITFIASPAFVSFWYGVAEIGRALGIYNGLEPSIEVCEPCA